MHLGIFVRITLQCSWATFNQHGTGLFTWHQHPSCVSSVCCLSVSLLCSCNRVHLLWETQSLCSRGSPVWILIHRNGRGLQTVLTTVPQESVAGSVRCGRGQTQSFVTIVALVSEGVFSFSPWVSAGQKEMIWNDKYLVPHLRTPVQNEMAKKSNFHIAVIIERRYRFTL